MYQALYRKYRPLFFDDVVGQEHVVNTIKNQIHNNKISHAYMFTGTRGTGKTTCAKIFARAVNCEHPINGDPCNECPTCKGILDGSLLDVFEIDAASNNGIDNIRELRDDIIFTPAKAKYKIYIIDEVHMLSNQAFNGLLKTLEEPPKHVIFIFATTEINKVPQTILSRCQRFDFKRISNKDIRKRIEYVADKEGLVLDEHASILISQLADGALRDALSILDRCINETGKVTLHDVEQTVGICSYEEINRILLAIAENDTEGTLNFYSECREKSKDTLSLFSELCTYLRDILIIKLTKSPNDFLNYESEKFDALSELADHYTAEKALRIINVLQNGINDISKFKDKHIIAEMALIKATNPIIGDDFDSLSERVANLEKNGVKVSPKKEKPVTAEKKEPVKAKPSVNNSDFWDKAIGIISGTAGPSLSTLLKKLSVKTDNETLHIFCSNGFEHSILSTAENTEYVKKAVKDASGIDYRIVFEVAQQQNDDTDDLFSEIIDNADDIL